MPGEITRRTWVRFPLGMTYQFLIIEIWLFQEETFSCQNWCICNAQLVYIYIWFENVNTWNVNEDAVIFLCDSAYLAWHWQHLNLKWIWMIVSRSAVKNLCICHAQLVYILSINVNARNANYDAMSFLCVSTDLVRWNGCSTYLWHCVMMPSNADIPCYITPSLNNPVDS